MAKNKKKKADSFTDPEAELKCLRKENAELRKLLRKIGELAAEAETDDEHGSADPELILPPGAGK